MAQAYMTETGNGGSEPEPSGSASGADWPGCAETGASGGAGS